MNRARLAAVTLLGAAIPGIALAQEAGSAPAEMARKLQNPLANIKAIVTDSEIGFETGSDDGTSFAF